jgi:hypothetical protein
VPVPGSDGRLESVYTLAPKARTALVLRGRGEDFHGRRFNPTLRTESLPHQIATNRVADWLGARLVPEHLLPARFRAELQHRPDGVYEAARADARGRDLVLLEVDLGSYSRERLLGKVRAFRESERARSILIVTPTAERGQLVVAWVRDAYGPAGLAEVQALPFDEVRAGTWASPSSKVTLSSRSASVSWRARSSIRSETSTPTTRPGAAARAASRVVSPVPQPMSRTSSPGLIS